jgi:chromosome segregation ATPase
LEKEKSQLQKEIHDLQVTIDGDNKQRQNADRLSKQLEAQLTELQMRSDEQARQLQELILNKNKTHSENSDLARSEHPFAYLQRMIQATRGR